MSFGPADYEMWGGVVSTVATKIAKLNAVAKP